MIVDLQNDFLHPDGAYGRAGQRAAEIAALTADAVTHAAGTYLDPGRYVQVTLMPDTAR